MAVDLLPDIAALEPDAVERCPWMPFAGAPHVLVKYLLSSPDGAAGLMRLDGATEGGRHLHVGGRHHVWVVDGTLVFDGAALGPGSYLHVPAGSDHTMAATDGGCTVFFVYDHHRD